MWAIRKASLHIKSQPFSPVIFRPSYTKFETASSIYTDNNKFSEPPSHISDTSVTLKRFYSKAHGSQTSFIGQHSFSSHARTKCSGEEDDDFKDNELNLESEDEDSAENDSQGRKASSGLFQAILDSPSMSVKEVLDKWLEEGNEISRSEISSAIAEFRKRRMYLKALALSQLFEEYEKEKFEERDYATRVDLICKLSGLQKAEFYINNKIPISFRKENVYQALLANCVLNTDTKKAEQVFKEIKKLKLPITTFTCEQMLLLYKRTDRKKMSEVVSLMEKENIKPSLVTYRFLIDAKGHANNVAGMEKLLEKMKGEGLKPDLWLQIVLARHYTNFGMKENAKSVLKEMEGENLNENRMACSSLLLAYASLGSENDVKRVWEICESDPNVYECMNAVYAFGKLKKVEEAEMVFYKMSKKWKQLRAKQYIALFKVYAENKMLTKGKDLVGRMIGSGCGIGPDSIHTLVKFYLEEGEIEQADWILRKGKGKPRFGTYMMVFGEYSMRGDVDNAERIFGRMRVDGYRYVSRLRQYNLLLQAYINAEVSGYGFRNRLKADGVVLNKSLEAKLAQSDAFKDPRM